MMLQTARTTTGIASLDQLLEGGFPRRRSFLVTGEPGTGKSIFALQFIAEGLKRGEKCIFVTADEEPGDVIEQAASIGWDLERHVENKELAILNAGAYLSALPGATRERHVDVQKTVNDLAGFVNQLGASRLALDPAGPFVLLRDSGIRIQDQARLLIKLLRSTTRTTNLLTSYAVPRTGERTLHGIEEYLVAGAIVLEMVWRDGALARSLIVEKMRCTDIRPVQLEFDIVKGQGIVIRSPGLAR
ncbi:MAG: RAD55 family ATPase [Candidatus Binatia bacterium]